MMPFCSPPAAWRSVRAHGACPDDASPAGGIDSRVSGAFFLDGVVSADRPLSEAAPAPHRGTRTTREKSTDFSKAHQLSLAHMVALRNGYNKTNESKVIILIKLSIKKTIKEIMLILRFLARTYLI